MDLDEEFAVLLRADRTQCDGSRAIIYVFGLALVIQVAVFGSVLPRMIAETGTLVARVPQYAERLRGRAEYWITHPPEILTRLRWKTPAGEPTDAPEGAQPPDTNAPPLTGETSDPHPLFGPGPISPETLKTATEYAAKALPRIGSWIFGQVGRVASWFGVLAGLALIPVYTFYFLVEKKAISSHWTNYLPVSDSHFKNELVFVLGPSINNYLIAFFRGQVLVLILKKEGI